MKNINLIILIIYFVNINTYSQNFWQQTNGPYTDMNTGNLESMVFSSKGNTFIGTSIGLYKSTDKGDSWTKSYLSLEILSLVINSKDIIYAGTYYGVYNSTDEGNTWEKLETSPSAVSMITNLKDDIFASTGDGGIYRSTNYGNNWELIYSITSNFNYEHVSSFTIDKDSNIFAGTTTRNLYRSTDNGNTWTVFNSGLSGSPSSLVTQVNSLKSDSHGNKYAATDNGIYCLQYNGNNWTPSGLQSLYTKSIIIDTNDDIFVGANSSQSNVLYGGGFRSTDEGKNWIMLNTGLASNPWIIPVAVNADGLIFASTTAGIFRSSDLGNSWTQLKIAVNSAVLSLATDVEGNIFAGTNASGIFRSTDKGDSWIQVGLPTRNVYTLLINSRNVIFAGTDFKETSASLFYSSDKGNTWNPVNLVTSPIKELAVNSQNYLFAGTEGEGIYLSTDNGLTWTQKNSNLKNWNVFSLCINSKGKIFAGTELGLNISSDNGNSWINFNSFYSIDTNLSALQTNSQDIIWGGTNKSGVYFSSDNGVNWVQVDSGLTSPEINSLAVNSNDDIFAGTNYGGVFRLQKGSTIWEAFNTGLLDKNIKSLSIDANGFLYAGTNGMGVFKSIKSTLTGTLNKDKLPTYSDYNLSQNYPNPFNPSTTINYQLPKSGLVELKVYDILGREVSLLVNRFENAGSHSIQFNGNNLPSGIYLYRINAGSYSASRKMILLK